MSDDQAAAIRQAQELVAQGRTVPAIAGLRRLLEHAPQNAGLHSALGDCHLKQQQTAQAIASYEQAAEIYIREGAVLKAATVYRKILKLAPARADIYTRLGDMSAERGQVNNAVADYLSGAKLYVQAGQPGKALEYYRKILILNVGNTSVRLRLAELSLQEGLIPEAVEQYQLLAEDCDRLGKDDQARSFYELILSHAPGHPQACRRLGIAVPPAPDAAPAANTTQAPGPVMPATAEETPRVSGNGQEAKTLVTAAAGTIEFNPNELESVRPPTASSPAAAEPSASPEDATGKAAALPEPPEESLEPLEIEEIEAVGGDVPIVKVILPDGNSEDVAETQYSLGLAYKELRLTIQAIEMFELAARSPIRHLDSCAMIAACHRDQGRNKEAIAWLERALKDPRCKEPLLLYVKHHLASLYKEEGLERRPASP